MPQLRRTAAQGVLGRGCGLQGLRLLPDRQPRLLVQQRPRRQERQCEHGQQAERRLLVEFNLARVVFELLRLLVHVEQLVGRLRRLTASRLAADLTNLRRTHDGGSPRSPSGLR
ncbi:hypothetical protein SBRY_30200 [Actinacidiphila bryophytorum]|uniref:Uncharacterized protein n=1 Tax=Actinacidiphila bryophytorum TaxID=1436133 RepID=A0A9W4MG98_9ACTN|nr:hypothetical protein SBRY_30200 [Actinacidiphila bryophytorum]